VAKVKAIPDNYPRVSPYLSINGAAAAIDFYTEVFDAKQRGDPMLMPDGKVGHAELDLGDSLIMLADAPADAGLADPKAMQMPLTVSVYVADVDDTFARALKNGAKELRPPTNQFYGDRSATFQDPFGFIWNVQTHIEDVSPEDMGKRMAAAFESG
jgi:PhnB protein